MSTAQSNSRSRASRSLLNTGSTKSSALLYGDYVWWTLKESACADAAPLKPTSTESDAVRITQPDYTYAFTWLEDASYGEYWLCIARNHDKRVDTIDAVMITVTSLYVDPPILPKKAGVSVTLGGLNTVPAFDLGTCSGSKNVIFCWIPKSFFGTGSTPETAASNCIVNTTETIDLCTADVNGTMQTTFDFSSAQNTDKLLLAHSIDGGVNFVAHEPVEISFYDIDVLEGTTNTNVVESYNVDGQNAPITIHDVASSQIADGDLLWWVMKQYDCGDARDVDAGDRSSGLFSRSGIVSAALVSGETSKYVAPINFDSCPGGYDYRLCKVTDDPTASVVDFSLVSMYVWRGKFLGPLRAAANPNTVARTFCYEDLGLHAGDKIYYTDDDACSNNPLCDKADWPNDSVGKGKVCVTFLNFQDISGKTNIYACLDVNDRKRGAGITLPMANVEVSDVYLVSATVNVPGKEILAYINSVPAGSQLMMFVKVEEACSDEGGITVTGTSPFTVDFTNEPGPAKNSLYKFCTKLSGNYTTYDDITINRGSAWFPVAVNLDGFDLSSTADLIIAGMLYSAGKDRIALVGGNCTEITLADTQNHTFLNANDTNADGVIFLHNQPVFIPDPASFNYELTICLLLEANSFVPMEVGHTFVKQQNYEPDGFHTNSFLLKPGAKLLSQAVTDTHQGYYVPGSNCSSTIRSTDANVGVEYNFAPSSSSFPETGVVMFCVNSKSVVPQLLCKDCSVDFGMVEIMEPARAAVPAAFVNITLKVPASSINLTFSWARMDHDCVSSVGMSNSHQRVTAVAATVETWTFDFSGFTAPVTLQLCVNNLTGMNTLLVEPALSAMALGDPHIQTSDGRWIDFYGDAGTYELFQGSEIVANARFVLAARDNAVIWHPNVMKAGTMMEEVAISVIGSGATARLGVYGGGLLSLSDPVAGTSFVTSKETRTLSFGDVSISWHPCKADCAVEMPWGVHMREQVLEIQGAGESITLYVAQSGGYRFIDAELTMLPAMQAPTTKVTGLLADATLEPERVHDALYNSEEDQYLRATVAPLGLGK